MKERISSFAGIALVFVCTFLIGSSISLFFIEHIQPLDVVYTIISSCKTIGFSLLVAIGLYMLFAFISEKLAKFVCEILLAIVCLFNVALNLYYGKTGLLLDSEIILRPFHEILFTIQNQIGVKTILATVIVLIIYVFGSHTCAKISFKSKNILRGIGVVTILFVLSYIIPATKKATIDKISYCVYGCFNMNESYGIQIDIDNKSSLSYSSKYFSLYSQMFPNRETIDSLFPYERLNTIPNVLGNFFKKSPIMPNVVVIVVESLGSDIFGINDDNTSFTPFLSELAKKSLVWNNCLSTTPRSFGVIPAISGSLPHGMKGFQFGKMPNHNSLFSLLKMNNYRTSFWYASDINFDRVSNYLLRQKIDTIPPFYRMYKEDSSYREYQKSIGLISNRNGWGYKDLDLFEKSFNDIQNRTKDVSYLDFFVTITMHEELELDDRELRNKYYSRADSLLSTMSNPIDCPIGILASSLYTDNALQSFFEKYFQLDSYANTIFIITGDHSMNLQKNNPLNPYRVPLIIYSPLLQQPQHFNALVSHNDITPSILSLLTNNFTIPPLPTVHWVSDGLDTCRYFHSNLKTYFMPYNRKIHDGIFGNYYLTMQNKQLEVYQIDSSLSLHHIDNLELSNELYRNLLSLVYIDNYVYENNLLTKHSALKTENKKLFKEIFIDSICTNGNNKYVTLWTDTIKNCKTIQTIDVFANIMISGDIKQSCNIVLEQCNSHSLTTYKGDNILKYVKSTNPIANTWYMLNFTENIAVENNSETVIKLYLSTDPQPQNKVKLQNLQIRLYE